MRWISSLMLSVAVVVVAAPDAGAASPEQVQHASVRVNWVNAKLTEALADLAAQTGVGFILDPAIGERAREARVTYASEDTEFRIALGRALKAGGLRYTFSAAAIWVSTPERVAEKIVYKGSENLAEAEPMSRGEALDVLADDEDVPAIGDLSQNRNPWRKPEEPSTNPVTGVTDFPAPPTWIDSDDAGNARFKYSSRPSFLKPEYRDGAGGESNALGLAIELINRHPEWSRDEIVLMLEKTLAASK
jgi:hypothetical protein